MPRAGRVGDRVLSSVTGNTTGLKAHHLKAIERIYRRKIPPSQVVSGELASYICRISRETGRQLGLFANRRGQIEHVFVGDARRIQLPDFGRLRAGIGRFRGLRLIHTHLDGEPLSRDDLTDLTLLRLDMVVAVAQPAENQPLLVSLAHILPSGSAENVRQVGPVEHHRLDMDFTETMHALEAEFARTAGRHLEAVSDQRALLVHVSDLPTSKAERQIAEIRELARTAGLPVVDEVRQRRSQPDPKYVVGKGKLEEVVLRAMQAGADTVLFDMDLHPSQARAISDTTDLKLLDRTMLILDIFAQRAVTRAGKIQVELAQLRYALPRLVAKNTMMSRLAGHIGGRGPGETKLEINRRRARQRISDLEAQIDQISRQRALRRSRRNRRNLPVVALVGYTNAGKSTLLNTITQSQVLTEDRLFATLDPSSRRLRFPRDREIIVTDTVGFIRELPQDLFNAFRATLEELYEADLLVHVVDVATPEYEEHMDRVEHILGEMGLSGVPRITTYNKADLLSDPGTRHRLHKRGELLISALDPETTRPLMERVQKRLYRR